jgi:hypothetical protein
MWLIYPLINGGVLLLVLYLARKWFRPEIMKKEILKIEKELPDEAYQSGDFQG